MDPLQPAPPVSIPANALDRDWLSQWVQPHHLSEGSLHRYHEEYSSGPASILRIPEFMPPAIASGLYKFLNEEASYTKIFGLYEPDMEVSEEEWAESREENRMYRLSRLNGAREGLQSLNPLLFIKLGNAVRDPRFIALFERLTGTALGDLQAFGGKGFGVGDYLRPHNDQGHDRRLAFIVYLCPE